MIKRGRKKINLARNYTGLKKKPVRSMGTRVHIKPKDENFEEYDQNDLVVLTRDVWIRSIPKNKRNESGEQIVRLTDNVYQSIGTSKSYTLTVPFAKKGTIAICTKREGEYIKRRNISVFTYLKGEFALAGCIVESSLKYFSKVDAK